MAHPSPLRPKARGRRFFAITLRVFALLIAVVAVVLGWVVHRGRVQRRAIRQIEQVGGVVAYDYPYSLANWPSAPNWLRKMEVTSVHYTQPAARRPGGLVTRAADEVPIRTFRYQGTNPNTLPPIKIAVDVTISAEKSKPTSLPAFEKIGSLTVDQIESAMFNASLADGHQTREREKVIAQWLRLKRFDTYEAPWQPAWLQGLIGDENLRVPTAVSIGRETTDDQLAPVEDLDRLVRFSLLYANRVTDAGLAHLAGLTRLEEISLWSTPRITDRGLESLAGLPRLRKLEIRGAPAITDAAMAHVARMIELRELDLTSTGITDAGLIYLENLPRLQKLRLDRAAGAGMVHLAKLTGLVELSLSGCRLEGAGLACLRPLVNLRRLSLTGSRVTDSELVALTALAGLQELDLSGNTGITSAGLLHLRELRQLRTLKLGDTAAADSVIAALKEAIPALVISRTRPPRQHPET